MPLKAAELHRLARRELGPVLTTLGFEPAPRTSNAAWVRRTDAGWLVLWLQPSRRLDAGSGARFTIELRLTREPVTGAPGPRARLAALLADADREELRMMENRVVARLTPPDAGYGRLLPPDARERWLAGWKPRTAPYGPDEDVWFRHAEEADARALMDFLARALPTAVDRFVGRVGGRQP